MLPYWRLSFFYLAYFAVIGAMVPYWPVYLQDKGFNAQGIGWLTAIMMASRIVAPYVWGTLADRAERRMPVVRWGALLALISFAGIFVYPALWWFALFLLLHSFFWCALLAQYEVVTLEHLGQRPQDYSRIRLWGSIGFIVAVSGLGVVFDRLTIHWLPAFVSVVLLMVWISSLLTNEAPTHLSKQRDDSNIWQVIRKPQVLSFFAVCLCMQASHGPYYTFFSLYMEHHGYSRTVVGQLWALGVIAEVVLFIFMYRLLPAWGVRFFILISLAMAVLRWGILACFPDILWLLLLAQCLHAFTFGAFHIAGIEFVRQLFPAHQAGRGQALYNAFGFGLGTVIGALTSGYLWEWSNQWTFLFACLASLIGFGMAWWGVKPAAR
jgi:PPP family 3-phenylpropionic acid transporter